jgi:TatA/E family protein of Tat protein translocase
MFGMGMPEIIIILVIALIVIGPKKLPELAKSLGKGMSEFKKATQEIKGSLDVEDDFKATKADLVDSVTGMDQTDIAEQSGSEEEEEKEEEKQPKYKDFDEVIEDFNKDVKPDKEETLENQQEKSPEKNTDGQ